MAEDEQFIQVAPYEIEVTATHLMPGGEGLREFSIRVSTPTQASTDVLYKKAVADALLLRTPANGSQR